MKPNIPSRLRTCLAAAGSALLGALWAGSAVAAGMCDVGVSTTQRLAVPAVAKPPFGRYYRDPAFGSRMIRITNSVADEVHKPAYSTMQAWNADESLLLLYRSGKSSGHVLLDGHDYTPVMELDIVPADIEEVYWSHTDPNTFFYVSKYSRDFGDFRRFDVSTGKSSLVRNFSKWCGKRGLPTGGNDVQMQSWDDDLFGFRCQPEKDRWIMFSYRLSTDEVITAAIGEGSDWSPWTAPAVAPSGERFWLQGKSLDADLTTVSHTLDMAKASEHANVGRTHDGHDALFQTVFDPSPNGCDNDLWKGVGHLVVHDLETGGCRPVINEKKGYPYTTSGTHVSAQAVDMPGWVVMSSIGYDQFEWFSNKRKAPPLFSEVYVANTDPADPVVCRLAHHRSFGKHAKRGDYSSYLGEPHATFSPSGTRVIFGSDWYDSGSVDSYVIELPGYQRPAS